MFRFTHKVTEYWSLIAECEKLNDDDYVSDKGLNDLSQFILISNSGGIEKEVGRFSLAPMPGCCGVVVSCFTFLNTTNRGSNLSDEFRKLKEELCKKFNYSMMIATTDMSNIPAVGNMIKSKYKLQKPFKNKRSGNLISLGYKEI